MANPATTLARAGQDERIPGLPVLPPGTDPATLTVPVYNPATDKTHQAPIGGPAANSNALVGAPKLVQYGDSHYNGVPAGALTLDRLTPATIVPGTLATVDNPSTTPLATTEPPKQYAATRVPIGTAGAVLVPRYIGAAPSDTVPILWQEVVAAGPGGPTYTAGAGIDITNNVISSTSAALVSQHTSFEQGRFTGPIQFVNRRPAGLSVRVISNVALLFGQVNYQDISNPGTWIPGMTHVSVSNSAADLADLMADVEADIAAIPAAALAVGGEVLFRTYPLDSKLEADFLLTGFTSSVYFGRALAFRVASSGVPLGNVLLNPQFVDSSAWPAGNGGVTIGNNQAAFTVRDAYAYQTVTIQADDYELRVRILNIDAGGYLFLGVGVVGGTSGTANAYYTVPGDYVLPFTWPTTSQAQVLIQGAAGSVVSYLYCVPQ